MRPPLKAIAWLICLGCLASGVPASARADWLLELPDCAELSRARLALIYPRPGLPAVAAAGETLVLRVQLPTALTPPPGIQQPRALARWGATLGGRAWSLAKGDVQAYAYVLEVTDVRPDGASSLVYRASVPVPAWVAPGSYDLELITPGGEVALAGGVRVLAAGSAPRMSRIAAADVGAPGLAVAPVDVWVVTGDGPGVASASGPVLRLGGSPAVVQTAAGRLEVGSCPGSPPPQRPPLRAGEPAVGLHWPLDAAEPSPLPGAPAPGFHESALSVARAPVVRELRLLSSGSHAVSTSGADVDWYPARALHELLDAGPVEVVGVVSLDADRPLSVRWHPAPLARLRLRPVSTQPGRQVELAVEAGSAPQHVAWWVGHGPTARGELGPPVTRHRFDALGRHAVRAVALSRDGRARGVIGWAQVDPATSAVGCSAAPGAAAPGCLWIGVLLLKRRRRRRPGNTLSRERR